MALKPVEGKHEGSSDLFFWDDVLKDEGPESIFDFSVEIEEEARHARDKCMSCDKPPTIDVLWAEGIGHAWFCDKCYTTWEKEHPGDVVNTKKIEHGIARMKFSDRNSPENLREEEKGPGKGWWGPPKGTHAPVDFTDLSQSKQQQVVEAQLLTLYGELSLSGAGKSNTSWITPGGKYAGARGGHTKSARALMSNFGMKGSPHSFMRGFGFIRVQKFENQFGAEFDSMQLTRRAVKALRDLLITSSGVETSYYDEATDSSGYDLEKYLRRVKVHEVEEAGRRVQVARVTQVKDILQAWQKLKTDLEDWLKWASYMDGDWVEAPDIHGEPVKESSDWVETKQTHEVKAQVREEIMQELFGHYVTISGTRVFIQESAKFASRDREWDASAAEKRIRAWAKAEDGPNAKYGRAFLYHSDVEGFGGYKLPYMDLVDGELKIVPRAIFAISGVLAGARGGLKIPEKDKQAIRKRVEGFYASMRKEFDDESIGKE